MKSIKPGRGPSFMGGIGSLAAIFFGLIWTFAAASMGAPFFFPLFGVVFIIIGIVQAVYNFKNATSKDRYSEFDITDENEEPDPLNKRFGNPESNSGAANAGSADQGGANNRSSSDDDGAGNFCPYCGSSVKSDYDFCRQCGKKL
jgi:hypothetical protein